VSLLTAIRQPGHGRRQAAPSARVAAENQRLRHELALARHQLDGAGHLIAGLRVQLDDADQDRAAEVRRAAFEIGQALHALYQEQHAHRVTKCHLETAVRSNQANANAETVQTDVTALRAATADRFEDKPAPGPAYAPYTRALPSKPIEVVPVWASPLAAHPANIPSVTP
jgi:hypothetical protein